MHFVHCGACVQDLADAEMVCYDGFAVTVMSAWSNGLQPKWSHLSSHLSSWNTAARARAARMRRRRDYSEEVTLSELTSIAIQEYELPMRTSPSVGILRCLYGRSDDDDPYFMDLNNYAATKIQAQFRGFRVRSGPKWLRDGGWSAKRQCV